MDKAYCNKSIKVSYFASPERGVAHILFQTNMLNDIVFEAGQIYNFRWQYVNDYSGIIKCATIFTKTYLPGSSFFLDLKFFHENFKTIKELRKQKLQKLNEI
jgi:hypothetical protein